MGKVSVDGAIFVRLPRLKPEKLLTHLDQLGRTIGRLVQPAQEFLAPWFSCLDGAPMIVAEFFSARYVSIA